MQRLNFGCLAFLIAVGCGGSQVSTVGGNGSGGDTQLSLTVATTGNGLVRGAGADCRGSCTTQYAAGAQLQLVAVADSGSTFTGWTGACSGAAGCDLTINAATTVSATFAATPPPPAGNHRLSVVVQGKGRVTSSPAGLDCDSSQCSADFADGTTVQLAATASSGFNFTGWGTDCSGSGSCTITLSKDATVQASFVAQSAPPAQQAHLTVSTTGPGTVTGGGLSCGATCDVTVAAGTQVTLTASAAAGARFTGWGGACSGTSATCQLTLQSDAKVTAAFQFESMVLVPSDGNTGQQIAINSTHLFFGRFLDGIGDATTIWSIPKAGGTAVEFAAGNPDFIVADDGFVYWTDTMFLYSAPAGGGDATQLHREPLLSIGPLALDETGALYFGTNRGLGNNGAIHRMQNRVDTVLVSGQNVGEIAVDATHVYYADFSLGIPSLRRVPRGGGAPETIYSCGDDCSPTALVVDSTNLYFRISQTGQVMALRKSDLSVRALSAAGPNGGAFPELALSGSVLYWNWLSTAPFGIFSVNTDGTGGAAIDIGGDSDWHGPLADSAALYYLHDGAIIRRLK